MIMVNNDFEFKIVTNHFKQDVNDDAIKEIINLLQELNLKNRNKIINIIKTIIELPK